MFFAQSQIVAEQNMDIDNLRDMPADFEVQTYSLLTEYSVSEAAELLGVPRTTMSSRLKKLKIYIEDKMGLKFEIPSVVFRSDGKPVLRVTTSHMKGTGMDQAQKTIRQCSNGQHTPVGQLKALTDERLQEVRKPH